MRTSILFLAILVLAVAPPVSPARMAASEPPPATFTYDSDAPDGGLVLRLRDAAGIVLQGRALLHADAEEANTPIALAFVHPDGRASLVRSGLEGHDAREAGVGPGVVYASVSGAGVHSPALFDSYEGPYSSFLLNLTTAAQEGYLVVAWARQPGPVRLEFPVRPETVEIVAETQESAAFELHTLQDGIALGAYPVGHAHAGSRFVGEVPEGSQSFSFVTYRKGGAAGVGGVEVGSDGERLDLDLTAVYDPREECICATSGAVLGTSQERFELGLTYVGESRTRIFGVTTTFANVVLPPIHLTHVELE